jgi:membrane associated rhomboid family serine protease
LLIFAATLTGDAVHLLAEPASTVPCIGASGGISGVIVFYALQFPHARLGFLFRYGYVIFRWIQIPAWVALGLWMLLQSGMVLLQLNGFSNVAATAHLGGAAAGFGFWLAWRNMTAPKASDSLVREI